MFDFHFDASVGYLRLEEPKWDDYIDGHVWAITVAYYSHDGAFLDKSRVEYTDRRDPIPMRDLQTVIIALNRVERRFRSQ